MGGDPVLGTRIRKRRQQLRLTQKQLGELVGADESSVINWESGRHYPRRKLGALEAVLGSLDGDDGDLDALPDAVRNARGLTERQKQALLRLLER